MASTAANGSMLWTAPELTLLGAKMKPATTRRANAATTVSSPRESPRGVRRDGLTVSFFGSMTHSSTLRVSMLTVRITGDQGVG